MDYLAVAIDALAMLRAAPAASTEPPTAEASASGPETDFAALRPEAPAAAQAEAAPERFRPFAVDAAGTVRYLDDAELPTWLADPPAWPEGDDAAEAFDGSPDALWAAAEEPGEPCPRCGSLAVWRSILDTKKCIRCEPPRPDSATIRAKAARIRQQTAKWRD